MVATAAARAAATAAVREAAKAAARAAATAAVRAAATAAVWVVATAEAVKEAEWVEAATVAIQGTGHNWHRRAWPRYT